MDRFQYELLSNLKERYTETHGTVDFQTSETGPAASARQFYLKRLEDNLVRPMNTLHRSEYSQGSGNELGDKMKALRSSSAMTFNILGNGPCKPASPDALLPSCQYGVEFEYQLPTLRRGLPANLDALLLGSSGDVIACEMKLMEWLTSEPAALKDKYLKESEYLFPDSAGIFAKTAATLNAEDDQHRYDFAQMFKHSLALYNACRSGRFGTYAVTLLNCVWEPPADYEFSERADEKVRAFTQAEHTGFERFLETMQTVVRLFKNSLDVDFRIVYLPAANLIAKLQYVPQEQRLIERYL